jgi:hypothetical protein
MPGKTKIHYLHVTVRAHKNVFRLDIAMDNAVRVSGSQSNRGKKHTNVPGLN